MPTVGVRTVHPDERGRLSLYVDPIRTSWRFDEAHCTVLSVMVVSDLWHVLVTGSKLSRSGSGVSTYSTARCMHWAHVYYGCSQT